MKTCRMKIFIGIILINSAHACAFGILPTQQEWSTVRLMISSDKKAKALIERRLADVDQLLNAVPMPVEKWPIDSNGNFKEFPEKKDFEAAKRLAYAYRLYGCPEYLQHAVRYIKAWAMVNQPMASTLQDAVVIPLFDAYQQIRSAMSSDDRKIIDPWLRRYITGVHTWRNKYPQKNDNWYAWGLALEASAAIALDSKNEIDVAATSFKSFLDVNLLTDGSTIDFNSRDSLGYHYWSLLGMLTASTRFMVSGMDFFHYKNSRGGSIEKSIEFSMPYLRGEKVHLEFVRSTYLRDITDIHKDDYNKPWKPGMGGNFFPLAAGWNPRWIEGDHIIRNDDFDEIYPNGNLTYLLNEASRRTAQTVSSPTK